MAKQDDHIPVGHRIRSLRGEKGYSLRALAGISGLSPNAISMIERGENSPTVSTLRRLANALEVPIAAFFQEPSEERVAFVKRDQRTRSVAEGIAMESLATGLIEQRLEPFLVSIDPGAGTRAETYSHTGEEFVYCLEGRLEYRVEDRLYQIEPGDSLLFKASQTHSFRNASPAPAVALIILEESRPKEGDGRLPAHRELH